MSSIPHPVLKATGLTVAFPGHIALNAVDFRMFPGEVHALLGENGAGKSTLIKALTGVVRPDGGTVVLGGEAVRFSGPADAQRAGIATVYQEIDLLPNLSIAENVMLGREPRRRGSIDWKATRSLAREALGRLGLDELNVTSLLGHHSLAVQQLVAIARAVAMDARVLVLDEPASSLDNDEVTELFRVVRSLAAHGVAILFVSHFLEHVYELADRLTVLRDGRLIGEYLPAELLRIDLVKKMVGRTVSDFEALREQAQATTTEEEEPAATPLIAARRLGRKHAIDSFDLDVAEGELIGVAGLLGSGRTGLARVLSGVDAADTGSIAVSGGARRLRTPRRGIRYGIVYSSENRRLGGIVDDLTVRENIALALQAQRGWWRPISRKRQAELAQSYLEMLDVRPADAEAIAGTLSGGNQQKVMLARLLALAPRLLILDEPTRGVDIGAKFDVQKLVANLVANGMSVVFISAELDEVLRIAQRILVLREHRVVADLPNDALTMEDLLAVIAYGADPDDDDTGLPGSTGIIGT
ncbi:MAG TPA: sugar ABC transporter ATP-binding protein [Humibacter sp.]|nr:sugar ABC transporter ATP-binding protein [Humibacter sp.]